MNNWINNRTLVERICGMASVTKLDKNRSLEERICGMVERTLNWINMSLLSQDTRRG